MTVNLPEILEIEKTIPNRVNDSLVGGDSFVDEDGRWVVELHVAENGDRRLLRVVEGDTVDFAGTTWTLEGVKEPTTQPQGRVATLTRVGGGGSGGG